MVVPRKFGGFQITGELLTELFRKVYPIPEGAMFVKIVPDMYHPTNDFFVMFESEDFELNVAEGAVSPSYGNASGDFVATWNVGGAK